MENRKRCTGPTTSYLECRAHAVKGGRRRNRCSFVKVGPAEKPQSIWEWGECTISRHNPAYPFCWISRWPLHTETRRHLHFTLRAVTMETAQRHLLVDVAHNFLLGVQIKDERGHTSNKKNTGARTSGCLCEGVRNERITSTQACSCGFQRPADPGVRVGLLPDG